MSARRAARRFKVRRNPNYELSLKNIASVKSWPSESKYAHAHYDAGRYHTTILTLEESHELSKDELGLNVVQVGRTRSQICYASFVFHICIPELPTFQIIVQGH